MTLLNPNWKCGRPSGRANRQGFTLIEVVLVLAILVILAGLVFPTMESMMSNRRLIQSSDKLQNDLLKARVQAMETGQAQVFRATINGNGYTIAPWMSGKEAVDASAGATLMTAGGVTKTDAGGRGSSSSTSDPTQEEVRTLVEDVQFMSVDIVLDSRNALDVQQSTGSVPTTSQSSTSGSISTPVLIYPDGTTTTTQIVLADRHGRRMALQLRGITGRSTALRLPSVDAGTIPEVITSTPTKSGGL